MTAVSPFHPRLAPLNRKQAWSEWATYLSPAGYADMHDIEYTAVREAVGVFDVSPLYKYVVSGPDAVRLVDRVITRDATRLEAGQVAYTPWCDEAGKVIDDGTVARLDETRYRWTAADPQYRWLGMNAAGLDVEIEDVTDVVAALALQGPRSRAVLEAATGEGWGDLRYFRRRSCTIAGTEVDVSRTGYTSVMRATTAAHEYSPFEIGLGRLVNFEKRHFVGRRALLRERSQGGPRRRLVGLEIDWAGIERAFARHDLPPAVEATVSREQVPVYGRRGQAGRATSTCWSPILKKMVALASVDPRHEAPGTPLQIEWTVEGQRGRVDATVVQLPFLDLPRRRETDGPPLIVS